METAVDQSDGSARSSRRESESRLADVSLRDGKPHRAVDPLSTPTAGGLPAHAEKISPSSNPQAKLSKVTSWSDPNLEACVVESVGLSAARLFHEIVALFVDSPPGTLRRERRAAAPTWKRGLLNLVFLIFSQLTGYSILIRTSLVFFPHTSQRGPETDRGGRDRNGLTHYPTRRNESSWAVASRPDETPGASFNTPPRRAPPRVQVNKEERAL